MGMPVLSLTPFLFLFFAAISCRDAAKQRNPNFGTIAMKIVEKRQHTVDDS
jgi:hypothetical protein